MGHGSDGARSSSREPRKEGRKVLHESEPDGGLDHRKRREEFKRNAGGITQASWGVHVEGGVSLDELLALTLGRRVVPFTKIRKTGICTFNIPPSNDSQTHAPRWGLPSMPKPFGGLTRQSHCNRSTLSPRGSPPQATYPASRVTCEIRGIDENVEGNE